MDLAYLDTSALAKWYLPENGSEEFSVWIQAQDHVGVSSLTSVEFRCLLARRQRNGELSKTQMQLVYTAFQQDMKDGHLRQFPVSDEQVHNAVLLLEQLPDLALRSLDALHLNIARDISATTLATADKMMAKAGLLLGFQVIQFDQD